MNFGEGAADTGEDESLGPKEALEAEVRNEVFSHRPGEQVARHILEEVGLVAETSASYSNCFWAAVPEQAPILTIPPVEVGKMGRLVFDERPQRFDEHIDDFAAHGVMALGM